MHLSLCGAVISVALLASHGSSHAAVTTFTDVTSWTAAGGRFTVNEDFNDLTLQPGLTIRLGTNIPGGNIIGGNYGDTALSQFNDARNPKLTFAGGTLFFGADWDLSPGGEGDGLVLALTFADSTTTQLGIANPGNGVTFQGFFGFVSDVPVVSIRIDSPGLGGEEGFFLDNLRFQHALPTLFNTGVDNSRAPLANGAADPHYTLVAPSPITGALIAATSAHGSPIPPWLGDDPVSDWVSPSVSTVTAPGVYHYQTSFDLTGYDPGTAQITGRWATDDVGFDILINGASTGQSNGNGFSSWTPFQITNGLVSGVNTLTFVVQNAGASDNPAGLRVEMSALVMLSPPTLKITRVDRDFTWYQRINAPPPVARAYHTAVWTGSEMIIWGGFNGSYLNEGWRYNPTTGTWTAINTNGAPVPRSDHTAVWTGSKMLIWGGQNGSGRLGTGGCFDPVSNSWSAINNSNAPSPRLWHTAVWTGNEMIVWGGEDNGNFFNTGARYNPETNVWLAINPALTNTPTARRSHTAVWTGAEMVVWGGYDFSSLNDGGRYDPVDNTWRNVGTNAAPTGRNSHTAVWTGNEMLVWGGNNAVVHFGDGGRYNPLTNAWTPIDRPHGAPSPRSFHTAVWTGSHMIIWGGFDGAAFDTGSRYDPIGGTWSPVPILGAPGARYAHTALWTGSEMLVSCGNNATNYLNDTWSYRLGALATLVFGPIVPGFSYAVERTPDLSNLGWAVPPGLSFSDFAGERTVIDPATFDTKAFYRVTTFLP